MMALGMCAVWQYISENSIVTLFHFIMTALVLSKCLCPTYNMHKHSHEAHHDKILHKPLIVINTLAALAMIIILTPGKNTINVFRSLMSPIM